MLFTPCMPCRYITSKTPAGCGSEPDCASDPQVTIKSINESLAQLGVTYIDLMLLHRPCQQLKQQ
jgi:aryl-alcohol dehydrogenase-like predicted oxidoreductase